MGNKKRKRSSGMTFYIVLLVVILLSSYFMSRVNNPDLNYLSDLQKQLEEKQIKSVKLNGEKLEVTLKDENGQPGRVYSKQVHPALVGDLFKNFEEAYQKGEIETYDYNKPTDFYSVFNIILVLLLVGGMIFFVWFTFNRQAGDGQEYDEFRSQPSKTQ